MNGLTLGVDKGMRSGRGLRRGEPLERRGERGGRERDEKGGVRREGDGDRGALDGVGGRDGEWYRGEGDGIDNGGDGDCTGV